MPTITFTGNTSLNCRHSMVEAKVSLPDLPSNRLSLQPLLSLGRALPNLKPIFLHFELSYSRWLFAGQGPSAQIPKS